jgi:hypothetical protein
MNPLLENAGQIAAIIICLFVLVFIILTVAFNLAMAFGMSWLEQKVQAIKLLRPTAESVSKVAESALEEIPVDEQQSKIVHTMTSIPATMHHLEKKVDQSTGKVANAVIEFRARTVQAQTIFKAFFLPGLTHGKQETAAEKSDTEVHTSDDRMITTEQPESSVVESPPHYDAKNGSPSEKQVQHASIR